MKHPPQRDTRRALRVHPTDARGADPVMAPLPDWLTRQYFSPELSPELDPYRSPGGNEAPPPPPAAIPRAARRGKS